MHGTPHARHDCFPCARHQASRAPLRPAGTVEDALLRWLRAAELTCDRAALLVAQDPAVVIGALMKLAGGTPSYAHELSVDAFLQQVRRRAVRPSAVCIRPMCACVSLSHLFLRVVTPHHSHRASPHADTLSCLHLLSAPTPRAQARSYDEATTNSMLGWYMRNAQTRALSHPLPVMRAREIDRWAQGAQYKGLLARNRPAAGAAAAAGAGDGASISAGSGGGGSSNGAGMSSNGAAAGVSATTIPVAFPGQ